MLSTFTAISSEAISDNDRLAVMVILILLLLLFAKQIASNLHTPRVKHLDRILATPIVALLFVFIATAMSRVADVLP